MVGRISLGMFSSCPSSTRLNLWGRLHHYSYSTVLKIENISQVKALNSEVECEIHNSRIPTVQEIKNNQELQNKLAEMYKYQNIDSDFQQLTIESLKFVIKKLKKPVI